MNRILTYVGAIALLTQAASQWTYPATRTVEASDTYLGRTYKDPYRWLEDLKAKDVETWFKAQADLTDGLLARIPARDALANEWMALDKLKPASYSAITYESGRVFYKKTLGGENVGKLYYRDGWKGAEHLLFDPSSVSPKGAKAGDVATIVSYVPSPDGRHVVLGLSAAGAEYSELRPLEVSTRRLLPESIYPSYGALSWTMDSKSFLYDAGKVTDIKNAAIELNRKTRIHRLGADIAADVDFFSNESYPDLAIDAKEMPLASIDESFPEYVIGNVATVQNEMRLFYAPASQMTAGGRMKWSVLAKPSDNLVRGIVFHKDSIYAVTHEGAPRYKVIRTLVDHPDWKTAETVVPEARDSIQSLVHSKDFLFIVYSDGVSGRLAKFGLDTGRVSDVKLPAAGTVDISCPDFRTNQCILFATSWIQPTTLYDYDADKDTFTKSIFNTAIAYPGFENLVTEEVEAPGHDGTMIPLSIIHRKDLKLDGSAPAILEGYGAYGISYTPGFNVRHSIALHGIVVAYAHVRGGSEKGEAWYKAGYKTTKPNTWKDFISAAEYLVKNQYTSPDKLGGTGTSAGGILISRAVTERPDLFAAAVCNVGVANAMRAEFSPNGPVNTPEFGTVKDETEAKALYEMDGVQHVQPGVKYPAVLGVAGWNDPRVVPWQPGKLIAAMQTASTSGKPVLLKVNYDNGHFTEEKIVTFKNFAGQYAFMLWQAGHKEFQPVPLGVPLAAAPLAAQTSRFQPSLVARPDVKQALDSVDARAAGIVEEWIKLVEIPAPSTKEQARAAYVQQELQALGLSDVRVDDMSNVSAVRKGTGGGPTVVFAAHMDTVFPDGTNVKVTRDGDVLRGPGVGDDTANLTALLEMFRALARGGVKTKGDLVFLATVQEELGLLGAKHWLETSGYKPDMFVAIDLSAEDVWYGALRITQYKFFFTSPGAHTLESRDAPSPAKAVSHAIAALYEIPLPPVAPGLGTYKLPVLNVGMIGGGTVFNAIPREAWFSVDLRSLDTSTQNRLEQAVESAAKQVADREGVGFRVEKKAFLDYAKARPRDERLNSPLVQTAVATANYFRKAGTPAIVPADVGSTDANNAIAMGIAAVAVGAVTERLPHRLEENADASSIVPGIKSLIALAVALGGS